MSDALHRSEVERAARRVRSHVVEMSAPRLTLQEARRLSGLDEEVCLWILDKLVREGWLTRTRDGAYVRPKVH